MSVMGLIFEKERHVSTEALIKSRAPISGLTSDENFGFEMKVNGGHVYLEVGHGTPLIFCHGIFGSFKNFAEIGKRLSGQYRVIVPCMPMYDAPLSKCTVLDLSIYLESFCQDLDLKNVVLAGNSMGGGTVLLYAVKNLPNVSRLMLFASSGLSFIPMRGGALKIKNRQYVEELMSDIFYGPAPFTEDEFQEVYEALQNKSTLLRIVGFTRSTKNNFLHGELHKLKDVPTLIIWGKQDTVTPPFIAEEFKECLPHAELHYLDECGHVPTYEKPQECGDLIESFLKKTNPDEFICH